MNIYEKIQKVKARLAERELKKSGENSYSGFKYYELGDFLPSIIELCNEYKLFTQVTFTSEKGILNVIDFENEYNNENGVPEYRMVQYESPLRDLELKGANAVQALGGTETYLRRYLYMNAFDIVEADMFDSVEFEKKKKQKAEKTILDPVIDSCKKAFTKADSEKRAEVGNMMKQLGYTTFADVTKKQDKNDIIALANLLDIEVPEKLLEEKAE